MLKFHPYSFLTGDTIVGFVIFCVLRLRLREGEGGGDEKKTYVILMGGYDKCLLLMTRKEKHMFCNILGTIHILRQHL